MGNLQFPELRSYEEKLELHWAVQYSLKPRIDAPKVNCFPKQHRHEVWVASAEIFLPDVVQVLCKAHLGENIDGLFATAVFARKYGKLQGHEWEKFAQKGKMFNLAWTVSDVWASDLRHRNWPDLTYADHETFNKVMAALSLAGRAHIFNDNMLLLAGLAYQLAEIKRLGTTSSDDGLAEIFVALSAGTKEVIGELAKIYEQLPSLTYDRDQDLQTLEKGVQDVSKALNFPISPRIIEEDGRKVWEL